MIQFAAQLKWTSLPVDSKSAMQWSLLLYCFAPSLWRFAGGEIQVQVHSIVSRAQYNPTAAFGTEDGEEEEKGRHYGWIFTKPGYRATRHHRTETGEEMVIWLCCLLGNHPLRPSIAPKISAALKHFCWCYLPFKMVLDASGGTQRIKHAWNQH